MLALDWWKLEVSRGRVIASVSALDHSRHSGFGSSAVKPCPSAPDAVVDVFGTWSDRPLDNHAPYRYRCHNRTATVEAAKSEMQKAQR